MSSTATLIDDFGLLSAQIAELEAKKKAIRDQLVALGEGAHEGTFYRVTISKSVRCTLDMEAVREKLSRQFIQANTRETDVITVKAGARNNINVQEAA
jgi:hypothetical protein